MLRLYSTLHRAVVPFQPRQAGRVGMYVCGPTVQSAPHIGHARSAVAFDVIRRYLRWRGFQVTFVRNVTDIDDKIIDKAAEAGEEVGAYARRIEKLFTDSYARLGVLLPDVEPRATEHIPEMHDLISLLLDRGMAYRAGGDVYFSVRSFDRYGRLSGRNPDELRAGARIDPSERKRDQLDFALWKGAKPGEPCWDSPWGAGRPGWHIECSAMARRYLGVDFDIHGGGVDLVFPHHENEIAQSEGATGRRFARYWLHNGMVNLEGAKMAKSTGNIVDLDAAIDVFGGMSLRLFLARAHYRAPIEYSPDLVEEAAEAYRRIQRFCERVDAEGEPDPGVMERFREAMDDDFGTAEAVGLVFDVIRDANRMLDAGRSAGPLGAAVAEILDVLGLTPASELPVFDVRKLAEVATDFGVDGGSDPVALIEGLLERRTAARASGDFTTADSIRQRLRVAGIVVEDTPDGPRWLRQ
jgi:cysteinyl-tRNA synthetase